MAAVRLTDGQRVAWVDTPKTLVRLGTAANNDVTIHHKTVTEFHAELLFRGLGTILRPVGRSRVHFEGNTLEAPVVLSETRNQFRLGDVTITVHRPALASLINALTSTGRVVERIDSLEPGVWRYRTDRNVEIAQGPNLARFAEHGGPHLSHSSGDHQDYRLETAPQGVAIMWLLRRNRVSLPRSAKLRIIVHIGQALQQLHEERACHGAVDERFVRITAAGDAVLMRRWSPATEPSQNIAPERRWGVAPSSKTDVFEWATWALRWLRNEPEVRSIMAIHRKTKPIDRDPRLAATLARLQHLAWSDREDPGQGALARAARLGLAHQTDAPLASS